MAKKPPSKSKPIRKVARLPTKLGERKAASKKVGVLSLEEALRVVKPGKALSVRIGTTVKRIKIKGLLGGPADRKAAKAR
jgi:hypothetical protein